MATDALPPSLPRDFDHWLGPWEIGAVSWIAGDVFEDDNVLVERDVWVRAYQERSHCDTPGCCEMRSVKVGPHVSGIRVVSMEDTLPQPGEPTMNLLWPERRGLLDGLAHLFRNRKAPH